MGIDAILRNIQDSCDNFITENMNSILVELEKNKTNIDSYFTNTTIDNIEKKSWGVYVFYINPKETISTFEQLNDLWQTDKNGKRLQSSKVIKGRFKSLNSGESICFYIGKSEDIASRIKQHINQQTKYTTYSLKLSEHDRLHEENSFSYSYYVIKESPAEDIKDGMKCLLVTLEKTLRHKLRPVIGKQ
jgi:hypothetical protein